MLFSMDLLRGSGSPHVPILSSFFNQFIDLGLGAGQWGEKPGYWP